MNTLTIKLQTPLLLIAIAAVVLAVGSAGGPTLERVATLALISVVFVVGLSTFSGNSGVMSFGHVTFMAVGAYTTAYLATLLPLPTGAEGGMEAAMTFSLHALGAPLAPALLGVIAYRFFSFWLPTIPAIAVLPTLGRIGRDLEAHARETPGEPDPHGDAGEGP